MAGLRKKKPNLKSNIVALLESRSLGLVRTEDEKFALFKAKVDEFACFSAKLCLEKRQGIIDGFINLLKKAMIQIPK